MFDSSSHRSIASTWLPEDGSITSVLIFVQNADCKTRWQLDCIERQIFGGGCVKTATEHEQQQNQPVGDAQHGGILFENRRSLFIQ